MSDTAEILEQAARWREAGKGVALATVVKTWGSSPRPVGRQARGRRHGAFVGSVSGGCVEGAVVARGARGDPRRQAAAPRFRRQRRAGLGSRARLRRQDRDLCRARRMKGRYPRRGHRRRRATAARSRSRPTSTPGAQLLLDGDAADGDLALDEAALAAMREALRADRNLTLETAAGPRLRRGVQPAAALLCDRRRAHRAAAGADADLGRLRGDRHRSARSPWPPRRAFPGSSCPASGPTRRSNGCSPTVRSAVVTLTHDPKIDDPALGRGVALGMLLHRRARLAPDPCRALRAAGGAGLRRGRARPHPRPDRACRSAGCRRPRSRSRSSPR